MRIFFRKVDLYKTRKLATQEICARRQRLELSPACARTSALFALYARRQLQLHFPRKLSALAATASVPTHPPGRRKCGGVVGCRFRRFARRSLPPAAKDMVRYVKSTQHTSNTGGWLGLAWLGRGCDGLQQLQTRDRVYEAPMCACLPGVAKASARGPGSGVYAISRSATS